MVVIYAFISKALGKDKALVSGIIYDHYTFMVQSTTEIIAYN